MSYPVLPPLLVKRYVWFSKFTWKGWEWTRTTINIFEFLERHFSWISRSGQPSDCLWSGIILIVFSFVVAILSQKHTSSSIAETGPKRSENQSGQSLREVVDQSTNQKPLRECSPYVANVHRLCRITYHERRGEKTKMNAEKRYRISMRFVVRIGKMV